MEIKAKINKLNLSFCITKETISKVKRQPSLWEKIIANKTTDKEFISKTYKQLVQLTEKAMAPTAVLLPGEAQGRGAWWAAVHGVAESRTRLSDFTFMHWRRKWQPTPVFLPGEAQGRGSLVGCRLWGRTESDTTEAT